MKRKLRKSLSWLLTVAMIFSLFCGMIPTASAAPSDEEDITDDYISVRYHGGDGLKTNLTIKVVNEEDQLLQTLNLGKVFRSGSTMTIRLNEAYWGVFELDTDAISIEKGDILTWGGNFNDAYESTFTWSSIGNDSDTITVRLKSPDHTLDLGDIGTIAYKKGIQTTTVEVYLNYEHVKTFERLGIANSLNNFVLKLNDGYYYGNASNSMDYDSEILGQVISFERGDGENYTKLTYGVPSTSLTYQGSLNTIKLYFFTFDDGIDVDFTRGINGNLAAINPGNACDKLNVHYTYDDKVYTYEWTSWDQTHTMYVPKNTNIYVTPEIKDGYGFDYWKSSDNFTNGNKMYSITESGEEIIAYDTTVASGVYAVSEEMAFNYDAAGYVQGEIMLHMRSGDSENNLYTVKYDANGGSGTMESQTFHEYYVFVKENEFTAPEGKQFENWNTEKDGSGDQYEPGYRYGDEGDEKQNVTLYAQWKDSGTTEKQVTVKFVDEVTGKEVGNSYELTVSADAYNVNASAIDADKIPTGYELASTGDILIENGTVTVKVRAIVTTKEVTVKFVDEVTGDEVGTSYKLTVSADAYNVNASAIDADKIPTGYELASTGDILIENGTVTVKVRAIVTTKEVTVKFVDEVTGDEVGTSYKLTVSADAYNVNASAIDADKIPTGYELASTGDILIENGTVTVKVRAIVTTKEVTVKFVDEVTGDEVGTSYKLTVSADAYNVNASAIDADKIPTGYELASTGDILIENGTVTVKVRAIVTTKEVTVKFVDEVTGDEVGTSYKLTVSADAYNVNASAIDADKIPTGYELASTGDILIENGTVTVKVRAIVTTKEVTVKFVDEVTGDEVGTSYKLTVSADAYNVNASAIDADKIPTGYELASTGDILIENGTVTVKVRAIVTTKEVTVKFVDEVTGDEVGNSYELTVSADAYNVNTSAIDAAKIPTGYELASTGDILIENGTVTVKVRAIVTTKEVTVKFVDEVTGDEVGTSYKLTVSADAYNVNTSAIDAAKIPTGYELASTGDILIENGTVTVKVRAIVTTKEVTVKFVDEVTGKEVGNSYELTVSADAYNVNTSAIDAAKIPTGYELASTGDILIENGTVTVKVRPVATTQTVGVNYWDIVNNEQAGEGEVTVAADATNVNSSALTDIPEGYELVNVGDFTINDGWIYVEVRPAATTQTVGVNYWDIVNNEQAGEGEVTVAADATNVNSSALTDIPAGYELVNVGDFTINDGWIYVEVRPAATTQTVGVNYWDVVNNKQAGEGEVTVAADATNVNSSALTDIPAGYELVNVGDFTINDGWIYVEVRPAATTQTVGVNYWDVVNNKQAGEGEVTVAADATNVNSSALTDIPAGYELVNVGDFTINDGWIYVEVRPAATTQTVGVNYWDIVNNEQAGEGEVTVAADATNVNSSALTDIPKGYELVNVGDFAINDGWIYVEVRPAATTQTVGVNYWDIVNNEQAGEGEVTVAADATNVNSSALTDIPKGYELVNVGDFAINDGWIYVEVRPAATTQTVGVNYWDIVNNEQAGEGEVTVAADATNVNSSALTDIPKGYELVNVGDFAINDGWIYVEVRPAATTQTVGLNYWDIVNNKQVAEGSVTVAADATNVNTSTFKDIPAGYELVWEGDLQINDGWVWVEVRPVDAETKTVGLNYWDVVNNKQVAEGSVTVAADATNVNTSTFKDIPAGYELVWEGDLQINDGWVWVEVRPVDAETKTVGLNYWDVVNNKQVAEGSVTVAADATNVNTSTFKDIPAGYELVWEGDLQINDGWVWVEVRPVDAETKTVGLNYWDVVNNKQVAEGSVTVAADATNVNTSTFKDIPAGYELVWEGDLQINDGWVWVEVRPVDAETKTVGLNYWDVVNNKQVAEGSVTVAADATNVNTSTFKDIPAGYELVWEGDLQINDGWVWVEVRPVDAETKTVGLNYWDVVNNKQVAEGSVTVAADATNVNTSTFKDIPAGYELVWEGDLQINDGWVWVEVRPVDAETKTVGLNYWDVINNQQVAEGSVTVAADATMVNTSTFKDIPEGYELVWEGDLQINDGWVWVEVRPVEAETKTVGLNYWDVINNQQVAEGSVTVAADAAMVNTSTFKDIPAGYELVWEGDLQINDGWVWVEVRPVEAETKTVGLNYWDVVNNQQVAEGSVTVAADATMVNTSTFKDIPAGYELVWEGDLQINDGWVWVEVRPVEAETKTVGLNYWDVVNNQQVAEGSVTVAADATMVNTSTFKDIPEGYELVWEGDLQINDGWVWVEVRPVEAETKTVGLNYWDVINNQQVAEGSVTVAADATMVNTSTFKDIPEGYELVWEGDLQINDGWVWVEVRPVEAETKTVGLNYWDVVNNRQVAEGSVTVAADATMVNTSTFKDIPAGYELVWEGDLQINDGWVWVEVRPVEAPPVEKTFTVTFDSNGGSAVASQTVKEGEKAAKPANPTRDGYTFEGWFADEALKTAYDFNTPVTSDITLYADWDRRSSGGGGGGGSSSTKKYIITVTCGEGGEITPDGGSDNEVEVRKGNDQTFRISADNGYRISDVLVDGESVGNVDKYTFEDVDEDHEIEAIFTRRAADPSDSGTDRYLNTKDHVQYMTGYPDGSFGPGQNMTRAEAAQMFYALLLDQNVPHTVSFSDVPADAWYAEAVNTLASLGMINGYPDGTFRPDAPITRAEFCVIALAFAYEPEDFDCDFRDVSTSDWFYDYVAQATSYGWISGADRSFRPNECITRAEVSVIVNNMLGRVADEDYIDRHEDELNTFPDVKPSHWAYYSIMETANSHDYTKNNGNENWR